MSSPDPTGEVITFLGGRWFVADAQHDESEFGEHWHLTVTPAPVDPVQPAPTPTDHPWDGDDDGHNCSVCIERDDTLHMCWPQTHRCSLCEVESLAWPDVMCGACREQTNRITDTVTDPVEPVLSHHMPVPLLSDEDGTMCRCGQRFDGGPAVHRRHLAEMVYRALGIPGPSGWVLGPESAMRERDDVDWLTKELGRG